MANLALILNTATGQWSATLLPAGAIASGALASGNLGAGAVLSGNIASGQIGAYHLGAASYGTSGQALIGQLSGVQPVWAGVTATIVSGTIVSGEIGNAAVVSGSIASGQIGAAHVAAGALLSANYGSGQIDQSHIASGAPVHLTFSGDDSQTWMISKLNNGVMIRVSGYGQVGINPVTDIHGNERSDYEISVNIASAASRRNILSGPAIIMGIGWPMNNEGPQQSLYFVDAAPPGTAIVGSIYWLVLSGHIKTSGMVFDNQVIQSGSLYSGLQYHIERFVTSSDTSGFFSAAWKAAFGNSPAPSVTPIGSGDLTGTIYNVTTALINGRQVQNSALGGVGISGQVAIVALDT